MNAITPIAAESGHDMPSAIAEAIGAIMGKVRNVEKHGENKFHNYKFARVEDLMFQVQPAMVEAGLVITQDEVRHEIVAESLMLATYAFSLSHKSGVTWGPVHQTGMAGLKNTKGGFDDKALNKCHTAARKYFILGLFQVPAGDLPDADSDGDTPAADTRRREPPVPSMEERAISHLRTCAINRAMYAEAWAKNKDAWKAAMDAPAYARVVAAMKQIGAAIPADEPPPGPPKQAAPADEFGIGDDEIPF